MKARSLTMAVLAGGLLAGAGSLAAPATIKYRIDATAEQVVDLTALGQGEQRQEFNSSTFITVTFNDSAGGRTVHLILDSVIVDSTLPGAEERMAARGRAFHGFIDPTGTLVSLEAMDSTVEEDAAAQFKDFFPKVRRGARQGEAWSDTTTVTQDIPNGSITTVTHTNYSATGTETVGGVRALKVEAASSFSQTGSQGPAEIDGSGTGTATHFIGPDGTYLGGTANETSVLNVTGAAPEPIPVTVKTTRTITTFK